MYVSTFYYGHIPNKEEAFIMKKIISVFLSVVMIFTTVIITAPVSSAASGADIPVIHVCGYGAVLVKDNADGTKEQIYPFKVEDNFIEEKAKEILPVFAKAFFTQKWDDFCDVLVDTLVPVFEPIALNNNGEADNNTRADWTWNVKTLRNYKNSEGKYSPTAYKFHYDWRLDPLVIADTLHKYIEDVLTVTGAEKVALYGRCLGSNVVAAYMQKYNGENVQEVIHYASSLYGADQCSKAFTGELYLDADSIERFAYDYDLGLGEYYTELVTSLVTLMNKTYSLDITCWAVNNVVEDIYLDIFPEILINSFGTFPSYWSMVSADDYDRAMDTVFYGSDINEYKGLIDKVENYRRVVLDNFEEKSIELAEQGIEYSNIVKYGVQLLPLTDNSSQLADGTVTVKESSFGATTSTVTGKLSDDYIENANKNGTAKYISPDNQIDASTCLFPDTTWFIKNLEHNYFPDSMNALVSEIVNNNGYTVESDPVYPQFMVYDYDSDTYSPMTADNCNTTDRWDVTFFRALAEFFKNLFQIIKQLVAGV